MTNLVLGPMNATTGHAARNKSSLGQRATVAWLLAVCALTIMLCLPFLTTVLGEEDGIWLNAATRLHNGRVLYRDFFQFLPPLSFLLTEAWLNLVGTTVAGARLLAVLTIAGAACFAFLSCRCATGQAAASAALAMAWVVVSQGIWTQVNHHWLTLFFSMAAVWATLSAARSGASGRWRPLLAGLAGGAAAMVTPTRGALVILASALVFLDPRRPRQEALVFLAGVAAVPLCMLAHVASHGAAAEAFADVVLFTMRQYSSIQHLPYAFRTNLQTYPAALTYPACALALAVLAVRDGRSLLRDRLFTACAAFGLAGFIGSYPRPDSAHLNFALPLALPLAGRCAVLLMREWPAKVRRIALTGAACLLLPPVSIFALLILGAFYLPAVNTLAGQVKFIGGVEGRAEVIARVTALPATDRVFFYPYDPLLPFLTGRQQVSRYDLFIPSYTTPAQYQEACASVMQDADWVLLDRRIMATEYLLQDYPAMPNPFTPERVGFEHALESGFTFASQDGGYELRRRNPAARAGLCEGGWGR